jgi:ABC-type antimicrobial peptide transport system permease subunit
MSFMPLRLALRALDRNRVRSSLTMLGVIIGVAAVIAMVAIGQGASQAVGKQIASMGQNLLMILPGSTSSGALMFGLGSGQTLTPRDADAIERDCPSAAAVGVIVRTRAQIVYENRNWAPAAALGCNPTLLVVRDWPVAQGECFSDVDVRKAAQVCLVGQTVADNLFQGETPVGKRIRVKGMPFRVAGLLAKKGANPFGADQDDVLLVPWTTCRKKLQGSAFENVDMILVSARSASSVAPLMDEVRTTLRANHRLDRDGGEEPLDDFTLRDMTEMMGAMTATTRVMTLLLAAIAGVSLVVGGIGIMNIMLVSVSERTREIGLRMAVGARARDVLSQFLVESVVLAAVGGVLGIALGTGGAGAVARYAHWPVVVSGGAIALAVVFAGAVGVIFGFYPAWRASRLDPIDALRYE